MTPDRQSQVVLSGLTRLAASTGKPKQYLIDRFAQERFLYRVSASRHRDAFVLKGGLLLTALTSSFYRATRDVDMRAYVEKDAAAIRVVFVEILSIIADDGVEFRLETLTIAPIAAQGARGFRVTIHALIGRARTRVQIDLGFDDVMMLPKAHFVYPTLLEGLPAPDIRAYSEETMIAEKLEAIAVLDDDTNSRLKDYDDIVELASHTRFDASSLWLAVTATFEKRGTKLTLLWPSIAPHRAAPRESLYRAYRKRLAVEGADQTFSTCLQRLRDFIEPLQRFDVDGMQRTWDGQTWTTES